MKVNLSLLSCFSTGNSNVEQNLTFLIQSSKVFLGIVVIAKPIKKQLLLLSFDKKKFLENEMNMQMVTES